MGIRAALNKIRVVASLISQIMHRFRRRVLSLYSCQHRRPFSMLGTNLSLSYPLLFLPEPFWKDSRTAKPQARPRKTFAGRRIERAARPRRNRVALSFDGNTPASPRAERFGRPGRPAWNSLHSRRPSAAGLMHPCVATRAFPLSGSSGPAEPTVLKFAENDNG